MVLSALTPQNFKSCSASNYSDSVHVFLPRMVLPFQFILKFVQTFLTKPILRLVRTHKTIKKQNASLFFVLAEVWHCDRVQTVYAQTQGQSDQMAWNRWDTSPLMY